MPPVTKIGNVRRLSDARVVCTICKKIVGEEQERRGKALCRYCEMTYYHDRPSIPIAEPMSMKEFIERRREFEERVFVKVMLRAFHKMSE